MPKVDTHAFNTVKEADMFMLGFNLASALNKTAIKGTCKCNVLIIDESNDDQGEYIKYKGETE